MSITDRAVAELRSYAKFMNDNAEQIIGSVDRPTWVADGGIRFSFTLADNHTVPTINVTKEYLVIDAIEVDI